MSLELRDSCDYERTDDGELPLTAQDYLNMTDIWELVLPMMCKMNIRPLHAALVNRAAASTCLRMRRQLGLMLIDVRIAQMKRLHREKELRKELRRVLGFYDDAPIEMLTHGTRSNLTIAKYPVMMQYGDVKPESPPLPTKNRYFD